MHEQSFEECLAQGERSTVLTGGNCYYFIITSSIPDSERVCRGGEGTEEKLPGMEKLTPKTLVAESLPKCLAALLSCPLAPSLALETAAAAYEEKAAAVSCPPVCF